ncbi:MULTISPECIES: hypothetical protein [unclassified Bradyrhizobium]|uniref:hypothetical protein n=1 Tax=unclassified Bradyrhizobium TaxID=2631580 RepID=UPI001FFAE9F4|nr:MULTISPECIES: hypothetical protein [unclassified Bradyrhizobium]MCK1711665.1 hypothetical protein [Bradyrhizobium sp. 143]MCK1725939.1 hypothetical protein [Bradyrhizobium sp. 142]
MSFGLLFALIGAFLSRKPKINACPHKMLKRFLRLRPSALHQQASRLPPAARWDAPSQMAPAERRWTLALLHEFALNGGDGLADAFVSYRQKAKQRKVEKSGAHRISSVEFNECLTLAIECSFAYFAMHPVAQHCHPPKEMAGSYQMQITPSNVMIHRRPR